MSEKFDELVQIVEKLRSDTGCPWDREQTRESLKDYLIEEGYEALEALNEGKPSRIMEELGDVLYQILFHAQIAREQNEFDMDELLGLAIDKMKRRHPHVFGEETADDSKAVLKRWEEIKRAEKKERKSVLDGVPGNLPALLQCYQIQKRAARVGFDWQETAQVMEKFHEETEEFREALSSGETSKIEEELGDLFFVLVNLARFVHLDPELVMKKSTEKFVRRFHRMEARIKDWHSLSVMDMDRIWNEIKLQERAENREK